MSAAALRSFAALCLVGALLGCRRAPDPEQRARQIIDAAGGNPAAARERWNAEHANRSLGLSAEVAWGDPRRPLQVTTVREIRTGDPADCAPPAAAASVFFRTLVAESGSASSLAEFAWATLDQAVSGHRAVRGAVAAGRGDDGRFWEEVERTPALERACTLFRGRRARCADTPGG